MRIKLSQITAASAAAAFVLLSTACPSGWSFEPTTGAPLSVTPTTYDGYLCTVQAFDNLQPDSPWATRPRIHLHCENATMPEERALCTTAPNDRGTPVLTGNEVPVFSFVHLSDSQLKERAVKMVGPYGDEVAYDGVVSGSNRDELLETHGDSALLATVLAINELSPKDDPSIPVANHVGPCRGWETLPAAKAGYRRPAPPCFAIHTGDSVDSGMFSELAQFLGVMNHLHIPYLNVVGNHDNRFFGAFAADAVSGTHVVAPFVPIGTTRRFMLFHSVDGFQEDVSLPFMRQMLATGDSASQNYWIAGTDRAWQVQPRGNGMFHGFDFVCPPGQGLCNEARGYYAFTIVGAGGVLLRMVVLNTSQVVPDSALTSLTQGADGNVLQAQIDWLAGELRGDGLPKEQKDKAYYFVFGHHNLGSFVGGQGGEIKDLLLGQPKVLAYVTGHTHVDDARSYKRSSGLPLWEIVGGSTLVYPQLGRVIEVLRSPSVADEPVSLFLRVSTFRQQISDTLDAPLLSPAGALLDDEQRRTALQSGCARAVPARMAQRCRQVPSIEPPGGYCYALAEKAGLARRGAARDDDADKRNELEAVSKTNGAMRVYQEERP